MLRIASGVTDQFVYFHPGVLGLSSFTVYRSRNGAAAAAMTTPTINETDSTNMQGEYELLLDEDMTIGAGNLTEHMVFWITHAGMVPQRIEIELFDSAHELTQMNAALDTSISELGVAAPTATPTIRTALALLYMAIRNKRDTTATTDEIHNDAGVAICAAGVSDDGVTFTKNEYA